MKKPDRLPKRNAQQVCMTLTGDPDPFILGLQTLTELLVVAVLFLPAVSSVVAVLFLPAVSSALVEMLAGVVADFGQDPVKGWVFG